MKPGRKQLLAAALSTVVAGTLAWLWLAREPEPIRLVDKTPEAEALLREHAAGAPAVDGGSALVREPIGEEDAAKIWPRDEQLHVYDPHVYYRYRGGLDVAEGRHRVRTSAEGYREDFDRLPEKRDLFVVVTGDSHTDGVCENRESFANRLEALLAERHPGKAIEVLNTGVSGYSFYHYLGSLERHLELKPDVFVAAFYGGNDFVDLIRPWHFFHHSVPPQRSHEYWRKLSGAQKISSAYVGNAFNQLLYFQYNPDEMDVALRASQEICAEIVRTCREHGIAPLFVYIPPAVRGKAADRPEIGKILEALELQESDCAQFDRLADSLIGRIESLGAEVVDLRRSLGADAGSAYYLSDLHISPKAHEEIARILLPKVEAAWRRER